MDCRVGSSLHRPGTWAAAAVALLVAFRIVPTLAPGGDLGVDVGLVCAGALLAHAPGDGALDRWAGLLRRGLPAYLACLGLTVVASSMFLVDTTFTFRTAVAASFGGANGYLLWAEAPVHGPHALANPVTHLWAVGVAAQAALLVLALVQLGRRWTPQRPWLPLAVGTLASAIGYLLLLPVVRLTAFYTPPFRLWELGLGTLVGLLGARRTLPRAWAGVGIAAVTAAVAFPHGLGPWPQVATVLGTGLILASGEPGPPPLASRAYAAYLWHWPVLALVGQTIDLTPAHGALAVVAIAGLTEATARLTAVDGDRPRLARGALGGALAVTALVGLLSWHPVFLGDHRPALWWYDEEPCFSERFVPAQHEGCLVPSTAAERRVFLVGDSHARMHLPAIRAALPQAEILFLALGNNCGILPAAVVPPEVDAKTRCGDFNALVRRQLAMHSRPDDLVVVGSFHRYVTTEAASAATAAHLEDLAAAVAPSSVVLLGDTPSLPYPTTGLSCQAHPWNRRRPERCAFPRASSLARQAHHDAALRRAAQAPNVRHLPLHDLLCEGEVCGAYKDGVLLYLDSDHLTIEGSLLLTEPLRRFLAAGD